MTRDGTVGRFRRNRAKPGVSSGHRSRLNDEDSVRGPHQGQQSTRTAPTGRTHDCKRPLRCTPNDLLPGGGHPHMRRREFITLLGSATAWPLAARAQQPAMPVVGLLNPQSPGSIPRFLDAFRRGLAESGYIEGRNVMIEYRWAEGQYDRLPELAADLVRRKVSVLAAPSNFSALAAKAATSSIPIAFGVGDDPVKMGLVESLAHPGGNAIGISFLTVDVVAKRLGLLRELVPAAVRIAVLVNPTNAGTSSSTLGTLEPAARALGMQVKIYNAATVGRSMPPMRRSWANGRTRCSSARTHSSRPGASTSLR